MSAGLPPLPPKGPPPQALSLPVDAGALAVAPRSGSSSGAASPQRSPQKGSPARRASRSPFEDAAGPWGGPLTQGAGASTQQGSFTALGSAGSSRAFLPPPPPGEAFNEVFCGELEPPRRLPSILKERSGSLPSPDGAAAAIRRNVSWQDMETGLALEEVQEYEPTPRCSAYSGEGEADDPWRDASRCHCCVQ